MVRFEQSVTQRYKCPVTRRWRSREVRKFVRTHPVENVGDIRPKAARKRKGMLSELVALFSRGAA